jgi:hypothetical protein
MTNLTKYYYAGHSYMGINYTYDSPCWTLHAFRTAKSRDNYVQAHYYNSDTGNIVMESVSARDAERIAGYAAIDALRAGSHPDCMLDMFGVVVHSD